ncbi:MAG TPA: DUF4252 domain-containing protein [Bacteroidales bacterium]|nr:DUF4252 domain-containing protein [Bacteroidales bacterium]
MKTKILFILAFLLSGVYGFAQQISEPKEVTDLMAKYNSMKGITVISMNNDMFKTIKDDSDLSEISFNFDKFQIFTTESSSIVNMMKEDFRKLIQNGILSEMMTVKDEESKVSFLVDKASKTKENVSVFFMIVEEEDDFVIMYFSGNIPIDKIKELEKNK